MTPPTKPVPPTPIVQGPSGATTLSAAAARQQARTALGTTAIRLVRRMGTASVYAPVATVHASSRRALAVASAGGCAVNPAVRLTHAATSAKAKGTTTFVAGNRAATLPLRLTAAERRTLRRRLRATARFTLRAGWKDGRTATGSLDVKVRRRRVSRCCAARRRFR